MSENTIRAAPTKEFFIHMLTRDVLLSRAIIDLVDNSIDGAKRLRPQGDFTGLKVEIRFSDTEFSIIDNCGGIPIQIARDYAFRFGRPRNAPSTTGSVGQFGVGMKRTFFKLGRFFKVESVSESSSFEMEVDVDEWLNQEGETDSWHFEFKRYSEEPNIQGNDIGTKILVTRLLDEPKQSFGLNGFVRSLLSGLAESHALVLEAGIQISVNGVYLFHDPLELLQSHEIKPAYKEKIFYPDEPNPISVRIYAGISQRVKEEGGWYIFCNGRMVIRADQSNITGWGEGEGVVMPKYHPDFAFFRGFVFFDCEDASKLPWTTTKTGVDADTWIYRTVREEMIHTAKPVLKFLRELASERAEVAAGHRSISTLERSISKSPQCAITKLQQNDTFISPKPPTVTGPKLQRIQYSKPIDEIEKVKKHLNVTTLQDVGSRTFDYFCESELEE